MRAAAFFAAILASTAGARAEEPSGDWNSDMPRVSALSWTAADGSWRQSAILDFAAIGVLGAGREAGYPELGRLRGGQPEALRLHVGGQGDFTRLAYVLRIDLAESVRIVTDDLRQRPFAAGNRLLDSAYGIARIGSGVRLIVGRQPVEVSRFQETPTSLMATGATPFVVDRTLPLRRWGVRGKISTGTVDGSVGAWLDGDSVEARTVIDDASIGRRAAASASLRVLVLGEREAHWLASPEMRLSFRAAALARVGDAGTRADVLVGIEAGRGPFGGLLEVLVSNEESGTDIAAATELSFLFHERAAAFLRAERDGQRSEFAAGTGISYFAAKDRRSRVTLYGWVRRDDGGLASRDGVVLQLQAEL